MEMSKRSGAARPLRSRLSAAGAARHLPRRTLAGALFGAAFALTACLSPSEHRIDQRMSVLEDTSEFQVVPAARAFVYAPDALITLERRLDRAVEQRISLVNTSTVAGDNQLILRAQTPENVDVNLFRLEEFLTRFGGAPYPFQALSDSDLQSSRDQLGPFFYAQRRMGTDTLCVVAIRRLPFSARPLPRGSDALDVMMRNCVRGDLEQALAPFTPERLAAAPSATAGGVLTLSPHAAPQGFRAGQ